MMQDETQLVRNKIIDKFNREKLYIQFMRIFLEKIQLGGWQLGPSLRNIAFSACGLYENSGEK